MGNKEELERARNKLLELEAQKNAIEQQMRGYAQIIEALTFLEVSEEIATTETPADLEVLGLTNAIRTILQRNPASAMSPVRIRDELLRSGFSTSKNLLINVHTALRRLKKGDEIEEVEPRDGEKYYQWVSGLTRILNQKTAMLRKE